MANYTKTTNFLAKDSLPENDSGKIIKGSEFDTEFNNLQTAVNTKADIASPALTGVPTAPTASSGTNTTQLATTAFVTTAVGSLNSVPSGLIALWSGTIATIPTGWLLCNGTSGTPDLRNRFVIGAHSDTTGIAYTTITGANTKTGGSKDAIVVAHTHSVTQSAHSHTVPYAGSDVIGGAGSQPGYRGTGTSSTSSTSITLSINSTGSSGTDANLVPYYALAYIMKS
jgi:hypothetical protein